MNQNARRNSEIYHIQVHVHNKRAIQINVITFHYMLHMSRCFKRKTFTLMLLISTTCNNPPAIQDHAILISMY